MGTAYSFLDAEKKTWTSHDLQFDGTIREANLKTLESIKDGENVYLGFTNSSYGGLSYQHWFVTNNTYYIEFGSPTIDIYKARVNINNSPRDYKPYQKSYLMSTDIRERVKHVLGMSNYSLCLRNCEHVANYIIRNRWFSDQMETEGTLLKTFRSYFLGNQVVLVNTFPSNIRTNVFDHNRKSKELYDFTHDHLCASNLTYYLDSNENTYNILFIGPTGAGKSHLINVFFNQKICESNCSTQSVTREIYFIRGRGKVYNVNENQSIMQDIIVTDTIGLCDTEWDATAIITMIKNRVCSNIKFLDLVFVVIKAGRLPEVHIDNINKVLEWLKFKKMSTRNENARFVFVITNSEVLNEVQRNELSKEIKLKFEMGPNDYITYTGFPPQENLNELTRQRLIDSWNSLKKIPNNVNNNNTKKIDLNPCWIL